MDAKIDRSLQTARDAGIDLSLVRWSLLLTPEQRLLRLQDWMRASEVLKEVGRALNKHSPDDA